MNRIYVCSSWRNPYYEDFIHQLIGAGHQVYDWRNPPPSGTSFHWSEIDKNWKGWSPETYIRIVKTHPFAARGFLADMKGMQWADIGIMLRPCGRSAHLELGWMAGRGKRTIILLAPEAEEPELMALMADHICVTVNDVLELLA